MKKMNLLITFLLAITFGVANAQKYSVSKESSILEWTGKKVTGEHNGTLKLKSGEFTLSDNMIISGKFTVDMTTIVCLDLENEEYNKKLVGDLTIKGITHPIEFKVFQTKTNEGLKFKGALVVDRTKYDIRYGSGKFFESLGDNMIYDDFIVELDLLATRI